MSGNSPEVKWMTWQAAVEERPGRLEPVELRKLPRRFITLERDRGHLWEEGLRAVVSVCMQG